MSNMNKIDENLYSRQIAVYGKNAMKSLTDAKVTILGFNGSCLELCKNLILAGVGTINLVDSSCVDIEDLATNYYATEDDIGKIAVNVIKDKLSELNPYVNFVVNDMNYENEYDTYVLINNTLENAILFNSKLRKENKRFIWLNTYGLMGNVFCDFGDFVSKDSDGENPNLSVIQNITSDGQIITLENSPHGLYPGDIFLLEDVKGIDNVNKKIFEVTKVHDSSRFDFKTNDINWSGYISGGRVIQQKKEVIFNHNSLQEQMSNPSLINLDMDGYMLHELFETFHLDSKTVSEENKFKSNFKSTLNGQFIPICSILGSYAAQEVIKAITGKYTPTTQWYYYHCYDMLPDDHDFSHSICGDRYDAMREIFGDNNMRKIRESSYFIVGSGAIGCEHLKNFSMVGIGSKDSQIYVTDMDTIERSNLNRQFLFRNSDIGSLKSDVAAREIMKMNSSVVVTSHQNKVCEETEVVYDSQFFNSIDGVANALDNIKARLYVDKRCIFHDKALFESGTLGTKGNTQVIIPRVTEHYGASQDPQEKSFPVCTIKNFPNTIEHTIHWARDEFESLFSSYPNAWNKYVEDPAYLDKITSNERGEMISNILYLWKNKPIDFSECVKFAINRFYEKYNYTILQLLHAYPIDTETTSGIKFWSGGKRCPVPLSLENNDLCLNYVKHCSLLIAEMFNYVVDQDDVSINILIIDMVKTYKPENFKPSDDIKVSANDKEEKENEKTKYNNVDISQLPKVDDLMTFKVKALEFEKDDDTNHHIDFITCSSNLRGTNYEIPNVDRYETKIKAGKIIPAISTTTSIVSGLVTIEVIKYILGKRKIEDFKNTFLNLAIGMIAQSEPMPTLYNDVKDLKLTVWDYYNLENDIKVNKLFEMLSEHYKVEIDTLSFEAKLLMSPMTSLRLKKERSNMLLSELLSSFGVIMENNIFEIQVGSLMEDEDYDLPNIKFHYKKLSNLLEKDK